MPKSRAIDNGTLEKMRQYYSQHPDLSQCEVAKKFGVSTSTVKRFAIGDNANRSIEDNRAHARQQRLTQLDTLKKLKRCRECGELIKTLSITTGDRCQTCHRVAYRYSISFGGKKSLRKIKPILEECTNSPTLNHHFVLDRTNRGTCKYCSTFRDFNSYHNDGLAVDKITITSDEVRSWLQ